MKHFGSKFERSSVGSLPTGDDVRDGWVAVSHLCVEDKKDRRTAYGRWYKIDNLRGDMCIYRILRFSPNLESPTTDGPAQVVLDWYGWLKLNNWPEDPPKKLQLRFEPCNTWEKIKAAWFHQDQSYRLARRIAISLGTVSVLLGILSLLLSLR